MTRRSRFATAMTVGAVLVALVGAAAIAAPTLRMVHPAGSPQPGRMVAVQRGEITGRSTWVGPTRTMRMAAAATAQIVIDYRGTAWTDAARTAFASAVGYWSQSVTSSVPIVVRATFKSLPGTTLGQAGPSEMRENFSVGALRDTQYPIALANAIAGADLNGDRPEIVAQFDDQQPWDFGTDNVVPPNRISFRTVVLHELGHGLGFLGSMRVSGGVGWWGDPVAHPHATIFDRFARRGNGKAMLSYAPGTTALRNALTSGDVFFASTAVSPPARLYAPSTYAPGSSFSHLDEKRYRQGSIDSLMTPLINYGEGIATAGPIALAALEDMGWGPRAPVSCTAPQDVDGDGFNDVIGVSSVGDLVLGRGNGAGRLLSRRVLGTGAGGVTRILVDDYTLDGCADLLLYTAADHRIWLIPGSGGSDLAPADQWVEVADLTGWKVTGMAAIGDFNGDTFPDFLVRADDLADPAHTGQLWLFPGDGSPLAGTPFGDRVLVGTGWGGSTELFSAGDVDGDGIGDLYLRATAAAGTLRLFPGDGSGGFRSSRNEGTDWNYYSELFASRDLSGDGRPDVVGRNPAGNLELNRTTATGGLQSAVTVLSQGWGSYRLID